ncbi:MAG: hypothetical protein V4629_10985 [Pseudomonadota bacterium]
MLFQKKNRGGIITILGIVCGLTLVSCGHKGPLTREKPEPEKKNLSEHQVESSPVKASKQTTSFPTDVELKKRISSGFSSLR